MSVLADIRRPRCHIQRSAVDREYAFAEGESGHSATFPAYGRRAVAELSKVAQYGNGGSGQETDAFDLPHD